MQSLKIGSSSTRNKSGGSSKSTCPDHNGTLEVFIHTGEKMAVKVAAAAAAKARIPRTRDDSSDEEDTNHKPMSQGKTPIPPGEVFPHTVPMQPFPRSGKFPPHHLHRQRLPPPPHMMPPQKATPLQARGLVRGMEHFQTFGAQDFTGADPYLPPAMHPMGGGSVKVMPNQSRAPVVSFIATCYVILLFDVVYQVNPVSFVDGWCPIIRVHPFSHCYVYYNHGRTSIYVWHI